MISVCMATYNGQKYLLDQINSILKQIHSDDELIISDDGSTDDTIKIIKEIDDDRIKLFFSNSHNYTANFENALRHAKGDIIFLSDQDDIWKEDKVQVCSDYIHNGYNLVVHNATVTDAELKTIIESRNNYYHIKNGFARNIIKTNYLGCCLVFDRKALEFAMPFPANHELCKHDAWIALCAEKKLKTIVIDDPLIYYRRHSSNASGGGKKEYKIIRSFRMRIYILRELIKRNKRGN